MKSFDAFRKLKVTYGELHQAMNNLGFYGKVQKSKDEVKEKLLGKPRYFTGYFDKNGELFYPLIQQPDDALVNSYDLFHISRQLSDFGYITHYDDLAKMIEQNRLAGQQASA